MVDLSYCAYDTGQGLDYFFCNWFWIMMLGQVVIGVIVIIIYSAYLNKKQRGDV